MKSSAAKRRSSPDQGTLPDLSAGKVEAKVRRPSTGSGQAQVALQKRAVWTGIKRKSSVSQLQLHLPGMGGIIL